MDDNYEEIATEKGSPTEEDQDATKNTEAVDKAVEKLTERLTQLPLSRIKSIMKLDTELNLVSSEAVFLITRATELFLQSLARESYVHTMQNKKKTIQKKDVDIAISSVNSLVFLDGWHL